MKKLYLLILFFASIFLKSQSICSVGLSPTYTFYPNTTSVQNFSTSDAIISLCGPNTTLFDTVSPIGGCRVVYLNSGTKYHAKDIGCPVNSEIYAKNNSTVVITVNVQAVIYYEPNATIINVGSSSTINTILCSSISFPTVACNVNGIRANNLDNENSILYPNPANDELNISMNLQTKIDVDKVLIYNSIGQLIREEDLAKNKTVNTKDLPNGIYILNLINNKSESASKRFVISR